VTREYFKVTGIEPILGRSFVEGDAERKMPPGVPLEALRDE
jgi:hypothetical protein